MKRRSGARAPEWFPTHRASVAVLLAGLVLAAAAAAVKAWSFAGSALVLAALAYVGDQGLTWWKARRDEALSRVELRRVTSLFVSSATAELPSLARVSDEQLGVHPARVGVPYQDRGGAERMLAGLVREGKPVVVIGGPLSGKTRMAVQVARAEAEAASLWFPAPPDGLTARLAAGVPHGCLVWLDHLERYLDSEGLRRDWVDQLVSGGNTVVATMGAKEHHALTAGDVPHPMAPTLERMAIVRLTSDDAERERLADQMPDSLTRKGVRRYGLAQYLGGGPLLVQAYEDGTVEHPLGAAMLRAASDWRRIGADRIARDALTRLAPLYLEHRLDDRETDGEALAWCRSRVASLLPPLECAGDDTFRLSDYLGTYLAERSGPVPDGVWDLAAALATSPWSEVILSGWADRLGRGDVADRLLDRAARGGDPAAAAFAWSSLGVRRHEREDPLGAERAYRSGVAVRDPEYSPMAAVGLAVILEGRGDLEGAEAAYREAISIAEPGRAAAAWYGLGTLLDQRDDQQGAARAWREAMASVPRNHAARGALSLGNLSRRTGDTDAATAAYQTAIDLGDPEYSPAAACELGVMLARAGDAEAAATVLHSAAVGNAEASPQAAYYLGIVNRDRGCRDGAKEAYQEALDSGHPRWAPAAALELAVMSTSDQDFHEARSLCAQAMSSDDPDVLARAKDLEAFLGTVGDS